MEIGWPSVVIANTKTNPSSRAQQSFFKYKARGTLSANRLFVQKTMRGPSEQVLLTMGGKDIVEFTNLDSAVFSEENFYKRQKHISQQKMGEIQTKLSPVRKERKNTSDIKNLSKTKKEVNRFDYANQLFIASTLLILTVDCKMKKVNEIDDSSKSFFRRIFENCTYFIICHWSMKTVSTAVSQSQIK
uniref:Uncharacterized protein n=1 Tax=Glossina austeni TaxID=7395 RepID=A0A1A9V4V8_GLOAU